MKEKEQNIPNITSTPKQWNWLIHLVAWGSLLIIPNMFVGRNNEAITTERYLHFLITLVSFMVMFYANYLFLIKKFLFTRQTVKYLLVNAALIVLLQMAVQYTQSLIPIPSRPGPPFEPSWRELTVFYMGIFLFYSLIGALSVAFKMTSGWYIAEAKQKELERSRSEAELQNLKSQLNPHFLFNTLNNIYSLIAISPERAQETVHDLSRLLRYVMYDSSHSFVLLEKDLEFVRNYVELMRIRLPGNVTLTTKVDDARPGTRIAPLLFISLIENAFKHGVSNNKPSFIDIDIHQEGDKVVCSIRNSDYHKNMLQDKSGSGIGLVNLERRLSLLYPGQYTFECKQEEGAFHAFLSITLNDTEL